MFQKLLVVRVDFDMYKEVQESLNEFKRKIAITDRSKVITYLHLNPALEKCNLYNLEIPEFARMNITRLRLSSHNLKIFF